MCSVTRFFASAVLIFSFFAFVPGSAEARWRDGWGPAIGQGAGLGWGWSYPYAYYPGPYYYATPYSPGPACNWVRLRVWRNGHWAYRRAWRCW